MPPFYSNPPDPTYERLRGALVRAKTAANSDEVTAWFKHLADRSYLWSYREQVDSLVASLDQLAESPSDTNIDMTRPKVWDLCRARDRPLPLVRVGASRRASAWLAECAARIIPVAERARYREEFEAELIEVGRGWRQFGHGVRVLGRAVPLSWELRWRGRERVR